MFANTFSEEKSLELYERYHIPASGRVFWGSALANIHPGKDDTYVDYHNDARPPLLFISGKQDHLFPPKVGHSNAKHYKSQTVTEIVEFDGPHLLPAIDGWSEVADFALDWALKHAGMTVADRAGADDPDSARADASRGRACEDSVSGGGPAKSAHARRCCCPRRRPQSARQAPTYRASRCRPELVDHLRVSDHETLQPWIPGRRGSQAIRLR